ncbi:hypothetical protein [Paenibacillus sp. PAMC21692]|uniref:XkdQ/YqbQ family protein n=1 Tax=Paenibacillus sp. PAMC21692 TaxID=2762320 RepID=UPI00164ECB26|nr:hypothetical protein [Paenibacillus sp. PAMC21692]QNK57547.1 hypothetical protein H7F31_00755 [Paenibacillus sp. PAMC21692]
MIEVLVDNKNGNVWDVSELAVSMSWQTSRIGKAGSLDLTLVKGGLNQSADYRIQNGDVIWAKKDEQPIFYGYVFTVEDGRGESIRIKAFDQIRYLLTADHYSFENKRASDVIRTIAAKYKLRTGTIAETPYVIPVLIGDGEKLLDLCGKALTLTLIHGGKNYVLYDDFGSLALRNVEDLLVDFYIGDGSLLTDYSMSTSIDGDTYNRIVLYKNNQTTGKRDVYMAQDSANIAKWGILQLYQSVDENKNDAQINELLTTLTTLHNRESKTLKLDALGDLRVRAGSYVRVLLQEQGLNAPFLVNECTHKFEGAVHTMSLDVKVIS